MSLNFYADANLTLRMTDVSPKRFLFPSKGGTKVSKLWIGDPFQTIATAPAASGSTTITLADTSEFYSATEISSMTGGVAHAISGANNFTYTGKTQSELTGVSGITVDILLADVVRPNIVYKGVNGANIEAFQSGTDLVNFGVKIALGSTALLGFPGLPAIFPQTQVSSGVVNALPVFVSVTVPSGPDVELTHLGIQCNNLYKRDSGDATAFSTSEATFAAEASVYAHRHDESLQIPIRILPTNRQVSTKSPGFIIGSYRWRGANDRNATPLVPTNWNIDPFVVGSEKFIAGYGDEEDLAPITLVENQDSIRMKVQRGEYFTGPNRYYLPAGWNLEFLPASLAAANGDGQVVLQLQQKPREQAPIFVGTYQLDSRSFYETGTEYKYIATLTNPDGTPRTDLPTRYFTLDRDTSTITLNQPLDPPSFFLGSISGQPVDYFDLGVYPVDKVESVYINRGSGANPVFAPAWSFDREQGTVQVPSIPGGLVGEPLFINCSPAVAVLYDSGTEDVREIDTVDFNPALSGLASGYFYLQHRRQTAASLVLSCDKPRIAIPATQASIIGLVAFGPVYFENDYALLSVKAFGPIPGETIPNAKLDVSVDSTTFTGLINYLDPTTQTITVVTGGDGTANMVFTAKNALGVWVPTIAAAGGLGGVATTSIANDTLVLPADIPLGQIWNVQESWLVTIYTVLNNDPLFGMVGGDPALGEIVFATSGTPGTSNYKTNGERRAWRTGNVTSGDVILPIDAKDSSGHSYTSSSFNGSVRSLVFGQALPSDATVGAYFVTFVQRSLIRMHLQGSNLFSNYILLQMQVPDLIVEDPWLVLNDEIQGRLEQFRLGYVRGSLIGI